jgi:uncharacterized protein
MRSTHGSRQLQRRKCLLILGWTFKSETERDCMNLESPAQPLPVGRWRRETINEFGSSWKLKAKFLALSYLKSRALAPIFRAIPGGAAHRYVSERPDTAGFLVWPYQCASWGTAERLHRIAQHFSILDELGSPFPFSVAEKVMLWNLDELSPGTSIILDQPKWLFREGLLALNLFCGTFRAYSVAFSLYRENEGGGIFIGGLQGRSTEGALELYKNLGKSFHGMRPRDLLLDFVRMLAPALSAQRLLAVANDFRYVRHPYFGGAGEEQKADYDAIWLDRGGVRVAPSHFELPLELATRQLDEVPSNKRAQYRRRNEMLEGLRSNAPLKTSQLLRFDAT